MNDSATQTQDVSDLMQKFNDLQMQSISSRQLALQATGKIQVTLNDGGIVGNTYIGQFTHNLGYAPIFIAYYGSDSLNQYFILPHYPVLDGMGATIPQAFYAYADATNLYVRWAFYNGITSFGHTNNGPFYDIGTSLNFPFFLAKMPILTN